jgi:hypothetical protein
MDVPCENKSYPDEQTRVPAELETSETDVGQSDLIDTRQVLPLRLVTTAQSYEPRFSLAS